MHGDRGLFGLILLAAGMSTLASAEPEPAAIPAYRFAYVTNQGSETVSVVDLASWTVVGDIPVNGRPAGIALSPDYRLAYVTAPEARDVAVIDTVTRTVVRRFGAGDGPLGIATMPDGRVLVADWYSTRVTGFDPSNGRPVLSLPAGESPSGIAVSADGKIVVSADRDSNQISITRVSTTEGGLLETVTDVVPVGTRPFGVTLDRAGGLAYTANVGSNDVTVIDVAALSAVASIPVGRRPYAVALSDKHGFVSDQYGGTITIFERTTNAVVATVEACDHPEGIAFDAARRMVYVACWGDNQLLRLSADTFKLDGKLAVGDGPRAFGEFLGR